MGELSVIVIHIYMGSLVCTLSSIECDTIQSPPKRICECVLSTKCQLGIGHINISIHLFRRISSNIWYLCICYHPKIDIRPFIQLPSRSKSSIFKRKPSSKFKNYSNGYADG